MTRWLIMIVVLLAGILVALIVWPRENDRPAAAGNRPGAASQQTAEQPGNFTVLVEGQEVSTLQQPGAGGRMADLPVDQWSSSIVSHIRSLGNTQIVVFADGSEAVVDSFIRSRMPQDVAYRAGYSRE